MQNDRALEDESEDAVLRSEAEITYNTQKVRKIKSHTISHSLSQGPMQTLTRLNFKTVLFIIAVTCILLFLLFHFVSQDSQGGDHPLIDETGTKCSNKHMDNILQQMMLRPQWCHQNNPKVESPYYRRPTPLSYFAYRLRTQPQNQMYLEAEQYYYQCKYGINNYQQQHSFCVIAPGRNLASFNSSSYGSGDRISYMNFFGSINRQVYSNYKLIVIDDASVDNSSQIMRDYLKRQYPLLFQKTQIISNHKRLYVLKNKDILIRDYCNPGDIVLDIDADDELIGRQVFKLVNALYHKGMKGTGKAASPNDEIWLLYLNNISFDFDLKQPLIGLSNKIPNNKILNKKSRRSQFAVMHLRTFRRQLYMSIPVEYFEQKGDAQNFHLYASDAFIYGALVELSGINHILFVDEMVYYYERANRFKDLERKKQCALESRVQTPFKELENLQSIAVHDSQFILSKEEVQEQNHKMDNLFQKMAVKKFTFENYNLNEIKFYYQQHPELQQKQQAIIKFIHSPLLQDTSISEKEPTGQLFQKVCFAYRLKSNPYNSEFLLAQSYFFAQKYALQKQAKTDGQLHHEVPICLNIYDSNINRPRQFEYNMENLLASISRQKYINFKVNILIDQQNGSPKMQNIKAYLRAQHPQMMHHVFFIQKQNLTFHRNSQALYVNFMIKQHCKEDDAIMILEPYGQIIGSNFFALINNVLENHPTKQLLFAHSLSVSKNSKTNNQFKISVGPLGFENATKINSHYFEDKWYQFFPYCFKRKTYIQLYEPIFCSDPKNCHAANLHWQVFQTLSSRLKQDSIEYLPEIVFETLLEQEVVLNVLEQQQIISQTIQKINSP